MSYDEEEVKYLDLRGKIDHLYNTYKDNPTMAQLVMECKLDVTFYDYHCTDAYFKGTVQPAVARKFREDIVNKEMDVRVLPSVNCIFASLQEKPQVTREMHSWSFVYYHGDLQTHYDSIGLSPGDLVQCSIDLYKFPLGMHRVEVGEETAICYLWEDRVEGRYQDLDLNSYPRKLRHGLIISTQDDVDKHIYAKKCMDNQEQCI